MHAVVNHFPLKKPVDQKILDLMRQELFPKAQAFEGFEDFYFIRVSDEEVIVVVVWATKEALEEGTKQVGSPWFGERFGPYVAGPPDRKVGEVIASARKEA